MFPGVFVGQKSMEMKKTLDRREQVCYDIGALGNERDIAEWSSLAARWAHNPKVVGSNPSSATITGHQF